MAMDDRINYLITEAVQSIVLRVEKMERESTRLREEIRLLHEELHNKPQADPPKTVASRAAAPRTAK